MDVKNNNNNNNELIKQDVLTTQVMMKLFVDSCLNEYELQVQLPRPKGQGLDNKTKKQLNCLIE